MTAMIRRDGLPFHAGESSGSSCILFFPSLVGSRSQWSMDFQYHIEMLQVGPMPSDLMACHHPFGSSKRSPGPNTVSLA